MLKIFKHLKPIQWLLMIISLVFIVAQVWLDLKLPDYMSKITMLVQSQNSNLNEVWVAGGYMLLCALGSLVCSIIVGYFAARIAASLAKEIRSKIFAKTMSFSLEEINNFSTASLITRSTNDITQIQLIVAMGLQAMVKAPIMAAWAIGKIAGKSWQWTTATAVAVIIMMIMLSIIIIFAIPKFKVIQKLTDNLNRVTRENLIGIRVVRAYNAEQYEEEKFAVANNDLTANNLFANRIMAIMHPSMSLIMSGLSLSIYWLGAFLISQAGSTARLTLFSDMVVFSAYAMQVIVAFMMLTIIFIMLPRASVSAKRINEVLNTEATITPGTQTNGKPSIQGEIEFHKVSFQYPDAEEYVLRDISFKINKGETVAFIGSTGSGKSTLINLIPRYYDATQGQILIDGIDVKEYTKEALNNKIGYVSQKAILFSGTIKSNVAYGDNGQPAPSLEQIKQAVEIAESTDFVESMSEKYDSAVAQGGTNLSGGQKQRISIARAICKDPEIYVFDDSFSALDYKTDQELRNNLRKYTKDATSLIVAQRIGTIKDADKIIVLDRGKMVGMGTHRELLANCQTYQEIAQSQLSKEELENE